MENTTNTVAHLFLESAGKKFQEYKVLGDKTIAQVSEAQLHAQPNAASNSIAMIIQHLSGNMQSRWTNFLTEDGEKPSRNRDAEFEPQALSKEDLLQLWNKGWAVLFQTFQSLNENDLLKTVTIRSQPLNVVDAINRQLTHASYHVGQLVVLAKWQLAERWQNLSVPKDASQQFNERMKGKSS
jgi:uncharacterized damage-inducible protein DinB